MEEDGLISEVERDTAWFVHPMVFGFGLVLFSVGIQGFFTYVADVMNWPALKALFQHP